MESAGIIQYLVMKTGIVGAEKRQRVASFHTVVCGAAIVVAHVHDIDVPAPVVVVDEREHAGEIRRQGRIPEHRCHGGCRGQVDVVSTVRVDKENVKLREINGVTAAREVDVLDFVADACRSDHGGT